MAETFTETPEIDRGLVQGNYFDYVDDEVALQAEIDLLDSADAFEDPSFPSDARALYFDPLHPPKGAMPGVNIIWNRLSRGEVMDCDQPNFCVASPSSPMITSGALGDNYFVNALRLMATKPKLIRRLLVSDSHAKNGIYTFKFYKAGAWRYVHIDDRIPCRQSGRVNFARNEDPNETFAMLLEKAYAKLHGCYEALIHGLPEKAVADLTPGGHCRVHRNELHQDLDTICDVMWTHLTENLEAGNVMGCMKRVPDPYSEKLESRQGITVGQIYEVLDVQEVTAYPTEVLDRLTVGMVCVRNLQKTEGFHTGPWSVGHQNWVLYREIGTKLRHRTREIMFERGLGLDPNQVDEEGNLINFIKEDEFFDTEDRSAIDQFLAIEQPDQPDELHRAFLGRANLLSPQPYERDIHWIQIEDFVDVFNRAYALTDCTFKKGAAKPQLETKRFYSKWMPGEALVGSGGPPLVLAPEVDENNMSALEKRKRDLQRTLAQAEKALRAQKAKDASQGDTKGTGGSNSGGELSKDEPNRTYDEELDEGAGFVVYEPPDSDEDEQANGDGGVGEGQVQGEGEGGEQGEQKGGDGDTADADDKPAVGLGPYYSLEINEDFTDNPMYPFSVSEPTNVCIALYQPDRRWSVGRLGEDPRDITSDEFASRGERLAACMKYGRSGIGFLVVKLFGMKYRCTEFKLRKVVGCSDTIDYTNVASCAVHLPPGRYCVIPFTNMVYTEARDYILHFHYKEGSVELEVEDVIAQQLSDDVISDDESDEEEYPEDANEDELTDEQIDERDRARAANLLLRNFGELSVKPPLQWAPNEWEYLENTEDLGVVSVFDEVGDLSRYLNSFRVEMRKLKHTIDEFKLHNNPKKGEAEASQATNGTSSKKKSSRPGTRGSPSRPNSRAGSPPKSAGRSGK